MQPLFLNVPEQRGCQAAAAQAAKVDWAKAATAGVPGAAAALAGRVAAFQGMLIKAAINGGRSKDEHPRVPVSPDEQAAAADGCLKAEADAIHLHVRSAAGLESLYAEDVSRTLLSVLAVCPKAKIGVTTGGWILPDTNARLQAVASWEVLPGFASVNFSEAGATAIATLLISKGVEVEAGLIHENSADVFLKSGLVARCFRVLLEPQEQEVDDAHRAVNQMESVLASSAVQLPRLLHGTANTVWPMLDAAIARGYGGRIGFEDTFNLPDGSVARSNEDLVEEALHRVRNAR